MNRARLQPALPPCKTSMTCCISPKWWSAVALPLPAAPSASPSRACRGACPTWRRSWVCVCCNAPPASCRPPKSARATCRIAGPSRVSCPGTLAQAVVAELMPRFLAQYPEVRIDMLVSNRAVNLVEEGIDVALRVRPSVDDSGSMVVKRLDHTTQILVASPELLIRQGTPKTLDDLAKLDSIAMSAPEGRSIWNLIGPGGVHQMVQHTPRYVADDLLTLKYAAVAGTGVCWMPDYMCQEEMRERKLVRVLPDWAPAPAIVHAVFPSRRGLSPAVRRFLDYLGEAMPGRSSLSTRQALQGLDGANI